MFCLHPKPLFRGHKQTKHKNTTALELELYRQPSRLRLLLTKATVKHICQGWPLVIFQKILPKKELALTQNKLIIVKGHKAWPLQICCRCYYGSYKAKYPLKYYYCPITKRRTGKDYINLKV